MSKSPRPHTDDEAPKPRNKGAQLATWLLLGFLILGLGGFGVRNFAGSTTTAIGSVGTERIPARDYARAIRQEADALSQQLGAQLGVQQAMALGLDQKALSAVVTRAALEAEARRIGLSIGDGSVAAAIRKMDSFKGTAGGFDRETYRFVLKQEGWTEEEFETALRADLSRQILQGAVTGGFEAPKPVVDALYRYVGERRSLSLLHLTEADLPAPLPEPTEDELKAWYDAHVAERYTRPDGKRIAYAALLPDAIAADQPVDEEAVKKLYEERKAEFVQPERRLVERLVYPDQASAEAAKARLDAGTPFESLVTERGLTLDAIDLGDVAQEDLGAAGAAVFAAPADGVVLADSDLGPALYRVNGILEGQNTSLEQAHDDLAAEIRTDAARRLISDKVEQIDDLLAGGAELKDLAQEMGMTYATLDHIPGQQGDAPIEGYAAFREAADKVTADVYPEAIVLDDGGVVAMQFLEEVPSSPIPLDEVRDKVAEDWHAARLAEALSARALEIKAGAEAGAALGTFGIVGQTPEISRDGTVPDAPRSVVESAFALQPGDLKIIEDGDFIAVLQLNAVIPAVDSGAGADAIRASLSAQLTDAFAADALQGYSDALVAAAKVTLDQAAINAVNASLQ